MTTADCPWDRLAILEVGVRRLALPLSEVAYFAQAGERRAVREGPPWLVGILAQRGTNVWLPVLDLALLWADASLGGSRARVVATHAGIVIAIDHYTITRDALPIIPLRPAPGAAALRCASLIDERPIPVLDPRRLVSEEQWQSCKLIA